jgi:hypothetical protein
MRSHVARVLGIFWIVALSIPVAWASETEGSSSEDWSFSATPYFWAPGLKGTLATTPPLPALELDAKIGDILKNLDYAFASMLELLRKPALTLFVKMPFLFCRKNFLEYKSVK